MINQALKFAKCFITNKNESYTLKIFTKEPFIKIFKNIIKNYILKTYTVEGRARERGDLWILN